MSRDWFAGGLAALALCLAPLAATPATPGADGATPASDVVSAARGYRASLDHLLPFREHAVTRARETAFARRQLLADGLASRREAEIAEQRLAEAEAALAATQAEIVQADRMVAEATAAQGHPPPATTHPCTIPLTPQLT